MKQPISAKAVLVALVCLSAGLRAENLAKGRVTTIISSLNTEASFCTDGDYYGFGHYKTCHTNVHVNPWIQVQLDEVVHVRTVVIVNREDMASNKLIGSEIRVGNLTDPKDANPSCGVVVDEGGIYDCDLWGSVVTIRRATSVNTHYHIAEIAVWAEKNIAPKGVASQESSNSNGNAPASAAQTPVPLIGKMERTTTSFSYTVIGFGAAPWWMIDFGISGVPIKQVLLIGRQGAHEVLSNTGYNVHVGESEDPQTNLKCNDADITTTNGAEVPCGKAGRYVGVTRPGKDRLILMKVAIFIDCNSPSLPWDPLSEFPLTMEFGETRTVEIPLATQLEAAVGVDVCGELEAQVSNLPAFCSLAGATLTCAPTQEEHQTLVEENNGLLEFQIIQTSLEHLGSTKTTTVSIEIGFTPTVVEPVLDEEVLEKFGNRAPFFEAPVPASVEVQKTTGGMNWSLELGRAIDLDPEDSVAVSAKMGAASTFLQFDTEMMTFKIPDLSSDLVIEGSYSVTVTLDDGKDAFQHTIQLDILPPEASSGGEEEGGESANNSTDTSLATDDESAYTNLPAAEQDEARARAETKKQISASVNSFRNSIIVRKGSGKKPGSKNYVEPVPPQAVFSKILQTGLVEITFNQEIQVVPNLTMITNGTIVVDGKEWPVLFIEIVPGEDSDDAKLGFTWRVEAQTGRVLRLQLVFDDALFISANSDKEFLRATFIDPVMFTAKNGLQIETKHRQIERMMPAQLSESAKEVQQVIDGASVGVQSAMAGNFVVTVLLSASLNQLLGMINTQQIIVMMPLFTVTLPANAGMFFAQMMTIAAFEIFDTKPYLDAALFLAPTEPVNANFEAIGLESIYFLHNMGTLVLAFAIFLLSAALSYLCRKCSNENVNYFGERLHQKLFWDSFINLVVESYSMLCISCMINLKNLRWDAVNTVTMSLLAIVVTLLLIAYPFYYAWLLTTNFERLTFRSLRQKHQAFYGDLELRIGKLVLMQPIWFLVRRLLLAFMVVFLSTTVIWQISLMAMNVIVQVILLGRVAPFKNRFSNHYEMFSETIVMMVMYHLVCFTPFVPDLEVRFMLGYTVSAVICLHLLVSLGILAKATYQDLRMKNRIRIAAKGHAEQRKELQDRLKERAPSRLERRKEQRKKWQEELDKREALRLKEQLDSQRAPNADLSEVVERSCEESEESKEVSKVDLEESKEESKVESDSLRETAKTVQNMMNLDWEAGRGEREKIYEYVRNMPSTMAQMKQKQVQPSRRETYMREQKKLLQFKKNTDHLDLFCQKWEEAKLEMAEFVKTQARSGEGQLPSQLLPINFKEEGKVEKPSLNQAHGDFFQGISEPSVTYESPEKRREISQLDLSSSKSLGHQSSLSLNGLVNEMSDGKPVFVNQHQQQPLPFKEKSSFANKPIMRPREQKKKPRQTIEPQKVAYQKPLPSFDDFERFGLDW